MSNDQAIITYRFVRPNGQVLTMWQESSQVQLNGIYAINRQGELWIGSDRVVGPWRLERSNNRTDWETVQDSPDYPRD